ncbi:hypothetical protein [Microbulbifer epialgicus]|uniref:C-type lectin domain-containing protein n=1 Tax=Microbulbifer epialgicus TaxID=393907 RepID=A0ABV4NW26_9GAMM
MIIRIFESKIRHFFCWQISKLLTALAVGVAIVSPAAIAETAEDMLKKFGLYYDYLLYPDFMQPKYGMALQRQLAKDTPFYHSTVLGTHNSYNSISYESIIRDDILQSGQHKIKVKDQIDLGAEYIELDYYDHLGNLRFCHSTVNCVVGGNYVLLADLFKELNEWAKEQDKYGTDRVVMVHVENNNGNDGDSGTKFYENLRDRVGDNYVYSPLDYEADFPYGRNYEGRELGLDVVVDFPSKELTKQIIRNRDKRFIFFMSEGQPGKGNGLWDLVFWHRGGLETQKSADNKDAMDDWLGGKQVVEYVGPPGPDNEDGKFRNSDALWTWSTAEPNSNGNQDCTALRGDNGSWYDLACSNQFTYACKRNLYGHDNYLYPDEFDYVSYEEMWAITDAVGIHSGGDEACREQFGQGWYHNVPRNAIESKVVQDKLVEKSHTHAWLAYTDLNDEGNFVIDIAPEASDAYFSHHNHGVYVSVHADSPKMYAIVRKVYQSTSDASCSDPVAANGGEEIKNGNTELLINVNFNCLNTSGAGWYWDIAIINDNVSKDYTFYVGNTGLLTVPTGGAYAYGGDLDIMNDGHMKVKLISADWNSNNDGIGFIISEP